MNIASLFPRMALCLFLGAHSAGPLAAPASASTAAPSAFSGMVWSKQGEWHVNGSSTSVRMGESMMPGSLLTASSGARQSITVLMPDGQLLLCECFEARPCAQGFRIPQITHAPTGAVWNMFVAVRNVLLLRPASDTSPFPAPTRRAEMAGRFEIVAPLEAGDQVSVVPALRDLPTGHYLIAVSRYDKANAASPAQSLDWKKPGDRAMMKVEGAGVYRMQVTDTNQVPRLDIEVLVTPANSLIAEAAALQQARTTVLQWSVTQPGWSLHEFLRVYLESRAVAVAQ